MKDFILFLITVLMMFALCVTGLKACDYEAEQHEIKNRQWIQDVKDGEPYTNYGE